MVLIWRRVNSTNAVISPIFPFLQWMPRSYRGRNCYTRIPLHSEFHLAVTRVPVSLAGGFRLYFGIFGPGSNLRNCRRQYSVFYTVIGSSLQGYEFYSCVGVSYNERSVQNVRRTCAEHAIWEFCLIMGFSYQN